MATEIKMICMLCKHEFESHDIATAKAVCPSCEEFYYDRFKRPAAPCRQPERLAVIGGSRDKVLEPGLLGFI